MVVATHSLRRVGLTSCGRLTLRPWSARCHAQLAAPRHRPHRVPPKSHSPGYGAAGVVPPTQAKSAETDGEEQQQHDTAIYATSTHELCSQLCICVLVIDHASKLRIVLRVPLAASHTIDSKVPSVEWVGDRPAACCLLLDIVLRSCSIADHELPACCLCRADQPQRFLSHSLQSTAATQQTTQPSEAHADPDTSSHSPF